MKRSRLQSTEAPRRRSLLRDLAAGLFFPLPDALDEFLAAEIALAIALAIQQALDDHLRRDAGVVHAGLPQRAVPFMR